MRAYVLAALAATGMAQGFDCSKTSVGFPPLNAPFVTSYKGVALGVYAGGANTLPADHEAAGKRQAKQIVPRDAAGNPNPASGRIVLLSVGMSNATAEFSAFKTLGPSEEPVTLVDGAQGGWSADLMVANDAPYWAAVDQRLQAAGVTAAQVQAVWLKNAVLLQIAAGERRWAAS